MSGLNHTQRAPAEPGTAPHGSTPLALAVLIAGVGAGILFTVFGAVRITQLRRGVVRERI
jgi:uncharacterized integral membrane protein